MLPYETQLEVTETDDGGPPYCQVQVIDVEFDKAVVIIDCKNLSKEIKVSLSQFFHQLEALLIEATCLHGSLIQEQIGEGEYCCQNNSQHIMTVSQILYDMFRTGYNPIHIVSSRCIKSDQKFDGFFSKIKLLYIWTDPLKLACYNKSNYKWWNQSCMQAIDIRGLPHF